MVPNCTNTWDGEWRLIRKNLREVVFLYCILVGEFQENRRGGNNFRANWDIKKIKLFQRNFENRWWIRCRKIYDDELFGRNFWIFKLYLWENLGLSYFEEISLSSAKLSNKSPRISSGLMRWWIIPSVIRPRKMICACGNFIYFLNVFSNTYMQYITFCWNLFPMSFESVLGKMMWSCDLFF